MILIFLWTHVQCFPWVGRGTFQHMTRNFIFICKFLWSCRFNFNFRLQYWCCNYLLKQEELQKEIFLVKAHSMKLFSPETKKNVFFSSACGDFISRNLVGNWKQYIFWVSVCTRNRKYFFHFFVSDLEMFVLLQIKWKIVWAENKNYIKEFAQFIKIKICYHIFVLDMSTASFNQLTILFIEIHVALKICWCKTNTPQTVKEKTIPFS